MAESKRVDLPARFSGVIPDEIEEVRVGAARVGVAPIDRRALARLAGVGTMTAIRWLQGSRVTPENEAALLRALGIKKKTLVPK